MIAPYPLGRAQWDCLRVLLEDGGMMTTGEIGKELVRNNRMTRRSLEKLVERGLVEAHKTGKEYSWTIRTHSLSSPPTEPERFGGLSQRSDPPQTEGRS